MEPEGRRLYAKDQYEKHKEKKRKANAEYRAKNRDRIRAQQKKWREANKPVIRRSNLKRVGFTPELFERLMLHQQGLCGICEVKLADLPKKHIHADHCHTTGSARGLLCHSCNTALGLFMEDIRLLEQAANYVGKPPATTLK